MSPYQIVQTALPDAPGWLVNDVIWSRTPFPIGKVTARQFWKAANGLRRAQEHGLVLCEMCHRVAVPGDYLCGRCRDAMVINRKGED